MLEEENYNNNIFDFKDYDSFGQIQLKYDLNLFGKDISSCKQLERYLI